MIKLFRNIRKNLLNEGKTSKYFKYAIGEIILVVIGILIAININTYYQNQGIKKQLKNYKANLLSEIENDLEELQRIDSLNASSTKAINAYFSYYNSSDLNIDSLNAKAIHADYITATFHSNMYTTEELIASGNISLFTQNEKLAIIRLKKQIELYTYYEKETLNKVIVAQNKRTDLQDIAYANNLVSYENSAVKNNRSTIDSEYYRRFNNELAATLDYYDYQDFIYSERIGNQLIELKKVLMDSE
jgi:hypothetical protein